ncbi:hypothetical protein A4X13_0g8700 [Tilletia indica]|uniref:Uncharacterized protein n=1 Tax=Tilletia indica TaxID=43049 RepID=A0A177T6X9_9BASI|nr:hypothetical protein A4X13_0g8700 [Tilletia indica]
MHRHVYDWTFVYEEDDGFRTLRNDELHLVYDFPPSQLPVLKPAAEIEAHPNIRFLCLHATDADHSRFFGNFRNLCRHLEKNEHRHVPQLPDQSRRIASHKWQTAFVVLSWALLLTMAAHDFGSWIYNGYHLAVDVANVCSNAYAEKRCAIPAPLLSETCQLLNCCRRLQAPILSPIVGRLLVIIGWIIFLLLKTTACFKKPPPLPQQRADAEPGPNEEGDATIG